VMALQGKFSKKLLRKAQFRAEHYDDDFNFLNKEIDNLTKKVPRTLSQISLSIFFFFCCVHECRTAILMDSTASREEDALREADPRPH
jgi:hypothetical protein